MVADVTDPAYAGPTGRRNRGSASAASTSWWPTPAARRRGGRWRSPTSRSLGAVNANLVTSVRLVREAVPLAAGRAAGVASAASPRSRSSSRSRPWPCPTWPGPGCGPGPRPRPPTCRLGSHPQPGLPGAVTPPTACASSGGGGTDGRPGRLRPGRGLPVLAAGGLHLGHGGHGGRRGQRRPALSRQPGPAGEGRFRFWYLRRGRVEVPVDRVGT